MPSELGFDLFRSAKNAFLDEMGLLSIMRKNKAFFEELHGSDILYECLDLCKSQVSQWQDVDSLTSYDYEGVIVMLCDHGSQTPDERDKVSDLYQSNLSWKMDEV